MNTQRIQEMAIACFDGRCEVDGLPKYSDLARVLDELTSAVLLAAPGDFMQRRLDTAIKTLAVLGWQPPVPWPPEPGADCCVTWRV
ncbi:hypothetical protein ACS5PN_03890 [Roseateles sp. NT4]|uniref:hypothetical protein n=1 Tax=Roseateles sp. NT4 TaxID=3453715 RepID=UPI003EEC7650